MTTSVVIPAFNGRKFLAANLPAVLSLNADEFIVVDDASADDTSRFLQQNYPQIKILRHTQNLGFPISVNRGVGTASGEIVILLNQDVKPRSDLLRASLPHFKNPAVFAVTFNEENRSWAQAKFKTGFIEYKNGFKDKRIHPSFWASGGSAAFSRTLWNELGGFDPIFSPGYAEDQDLGFRAYKRGYQIIWDPKAAVEHASPESTFSKSFSPARLGYIKERNFLLVHWKNLDPVNLKSNIYHLISKIFHHPGFIVPTLMALTRLPRVLSFRRRERRFIKLNDTAIFAKFSK